MVNGSDHLTAYNLYAEAVNQHGYLGEVYGLPAPPVRGRARRMGGAARRLVKAIEDTALGTGFGVSVARAAAAEAVARTPRKEIRTQLGRAARAVHAVRPRDRRAHRRRPGGAGLQDIGGGKLGRGGGQPRFFADRFGIARASIEGTTLSYDLVGAHARSGPRGSS